MFYTNTHLVIHDPSPPPPLRPSPQSPTIDRLSVDPLLAFAGPLPGSSFYRSLASSCPSHCPPRRCSSAPCLIGGSPPLRRPRVPVDASGPVPCTRGAGFCFTISYHSPSLMTGLAWFLLPQGPPSPPVLAPPPRGFNGGSHLPLRPTVSGSSLHPNLLFWPLLPHTTTPPHPALASLCNTPVCTSPPPRPRQSHFLPVFPDRCFEKWTNAIPSFPSLPPPLPQPSPSFPPVALKLTPSAPSFLHTLFSRLLFTISPEGRSSGGPRLIRSFGPGA